MDVRQFSIYLLLILAFTGIAIGKLPKLQMNRVSIAFAASVILLLLGAISPRSAFESVDIETLALLFAMMVLVANLRISGFFSVACIKILQYARNPRTLLALVILASGFLSAFFLNDTICLLFTPLVAEMTRRSERDGRPYLIGLAVASNAGSCATSIGNPQNMLIASQSGLTFLTFITRLGIPSLFALITCYFAVLISFKKEFSVNSPLLIQDPQHESARAGSGPLNRDLLIKSLIAAGILVLMLVLGVSTSIAALASAAFLLVTRRTNPERVLELVDFPLLVFFSGLFIITRAVAGTPLFNNFLNASQPVLRQPGLAYALTIAGTSNLVSNVPAVMLLAPLAKAFTDSTTAWLILAMASTFAGNFTLLGSVANLIVAEQGGKSGIKLGFIDYFHVGAPVTLISLAFGTLWLGGF